MMQNLLQEIKSIENRENIAMVTNVTWKHDEWDKQHFCRVVAYDPVVEKNIILEL